MLSRQRHIGEYCQGKHLHCKVSYFVKQNTPIIAAAEVFGCKGMLAHKLLCEFQFQVGKRFDRTAASKHLQTLKQSQQFDYIGLAAVTYPYHSQLIYVTIDAVELGMSQCQWSDPPSGWNPVSGELYSLFPLASRNHPAEERNQGNVHVLRTAIHQHWPELLNCLTKDYRPLHRRVAATLLGWAPPEYEVMITLLSALMDPDEAVRNEAGRSLIPICRHPTMKTAIAAHLSPVFQLLNGPSTTDRNKAAAILFELIELESVQHAVRQQAINRLKLMARLKQPNNNLLARLLLARLQHPSILKPWILVSSVANNFALGLNAVIRSSLLDLDLFFDQAKR